MLADYEQLVADQVRDDAAKLTLAEKDRAIAAAVLRYSEDRPQEKAEDITPDSANVLPLPDAWEADFSVVRSLEYPIGDIPATMVDQGRYRLYRSPSGLKIQVDDAVQVAADVVRALYTIKHVVSAAADTIPLQHREPVACLASAICCEQLASFYSGGVDSSIQADSVEQRSKAQEYSTRAKALRKRYHDELGIEDKRSQPAGTVVQIKQADTWGGERLNHPPIVHR